MSDTFALIVTADLEIQKVNQEGVVSTLTPANFARELSVCADGTIWAVCNTPVQGSGGGDILLCSKDGGTTFQKPGGNEVIGAVRIAGAPDGSCWFLDDDHAIWSVTASGTRAQIAPADTAIDIAIDAVGRVWIISTKINVQMEGNIVQETTVTEKTFKNIPKDPVAQRIAAWQDGSAWIVTTKGEVGFIELDGTTGILSPAGVEIALDISISPNGGTTWIVGFKPDESAGGNEIQYWDERGLKSSDWKVVPGTGAMAIAGGG